MRDLMKLLSAAPVARAAGEEEPGKEVPEPPVPPDMEPVVPQQDPPAPGWPGDGERPPIIALG